MSDLRIAIIGAGLGGIAAAIKLQEAGYQNVQVFDKNDRIGGTWAENTYPGCQCDVPVSLYQFSFAQSVNWSRLFPSANEIQAYAEEIVDRYGIRSQLRLNTTITSAEWDEESNLWHLKTDGGEEISAEVLIGALGQLNRPRFPEINGRETFQGASMHSARWDHSVNFEGKRVGVIGCAASAVQLIPELAKVASTLTIFQRSPNWIVQRNDRPVPPEELALLMTDPETAQKLGAATRNLLYENADVFFWQAFSWTPEGRAAYTHQATEHLNDQVKDEALRKKLTPSYPIGCRRILFCDDYYPCLQEEHVQLVTESIKEVVPKGIVTDDGKTQEFDILVCATGFETTAWNWSVDIVGKGKQSLKQVWSPTPRAYLGITVSDFPNFFVLYGPNTNLGHNSITFMLERQIEYTVKAVDLLKTNGYKALTPLKTAQDEFNDKIQKQLEKTVWADPACNSWYKNADGFITQNWSDHTRAYAASVSEVQLDDYEVVS